MLSYNISVDSTEHKLKRVAKQQVTPNWAKKLYLDAKCTEACRENRKNFGLFLDILIMCFGTKKMGYDIQWSFFNIEYVKVTLKWTEKTSAWRRGHAERTEENFP